jgi:cytochrome c556
MTEDQKQKLRQVLMREATRISQKLAQERDELDLHVQELEQRLAQLQKKREQSPFPAPGSRH